MLGDRSPGHVEAVCAWFRVTFFIARILTFEPSCAPQVSSLRVCIELYHGGLAVIRTADSVARVVIERAVNLPRLVLPKGVVSGALTVSFPPSKYRERCSDCVLCRYSSEVVYKRGCNEREGCNDCMILRIISAGLVVRQASSPVVFPYGGMTSRVPVTDLHVPHTDVRNQKSKSPQRYKTARAFCSLFLLRASRFWATLQISFCAPSCVCTQFSWTESSLAYPQCPDWRRQCLSSTPLFGKALARPRIILQFPPHCQ